LIAIESFMALHCREREQCRTDRAPPRQSCSFGKFLHDHVGRFTLRTVTETNERPNDTSPGPGLSVLVVEDRADEAFLVTEALAGNGFATSRIAATAAAAIAALDGWTPDLIVLDLGLPDVDGLDVLQVLSRGERLGVPVMVITGETNPERRVRALELGAKDVVVKPFDLLELGTRAAHVVRDHDDMEAADVVARTLAKELSELSIELDEQARTATEALMSALELRCPELAQHSQRVGLLVERLAEAIGLDDVAEQLGVAAACHQMGALALDDAALAALQAGQPAAEASCAAATAAILSAHHRLAVAASRFREPADAFAQPVDRLVAQLTAVCHTFDDRAHTADGLDVAAGLAALQEGLDHGLDVEFVRCFVEAGLAGDTHS
jgi:DNA-binding response OmpR family regulator